MIIKVKGPAVSVSTANTVLDSTLVRIYATNAATITIAGTVNGSFDMNQYQVEYVEKVTTDTITASAAVSCTPVSYRA
jgi:hypothetical protein